MHRDGNTIAYLYRIEHVNFRQGVDVRLAVADLTEDQVRVL